MQAFRQQLSFLLCSIPLILSAQYLGMEELNPAQISIWSSQANAEYAGTYHFGDSEEESTLSLIITPKKIVAQIKKGGWSDGPEMAWVYRYRNLSNVNVIGNSFFSDEFEGEFVYVEENGERRAGLKIRNSWSGNVPNGKFEVGLRNGKIALEGEYPEASTRFLTAIELSRMGKDELKVMRNEIFARYGYRFREGGNMLAHFTETRWYKGQHSNVDVFLTEIEKANIQTIRSVELAE